MNLLLDTRVFSWFVDDDSRLSDSFVVRSRWNGYPKMKLELERKIFPF